MREVVVARADEISPGERKLVSIGGRSIGVFNVAGEYFALRNRCPHQGGPLCEGFQFAPLRASEPGRYERGGVGEIIRCPWHGWEFEVRTGRSWFDPAHTRVRAYPAHLSEQPDEAEAGTDPARVSEAPPQAETYRARRDGPYVVVELGR